MSLWRTNQRNRMYHDVAYRKRQGAKTSMTFGVGVQKWSRQARTVEVYMEVYIHLEIYPRCPR